MSCLRIRDAEGQPWWAWTFFRTSHGFFYIIIFKPLTKESAQLLLNCTKMLTPTKLRAHTTLEMHTHANAIHLVPVCTRSYKYAIFPVLRASLTLIFSFSSLLCWHQLLPFISPSHTLPLCCESSDLPAWPSPAWIIAVSYLLTNFYLSPTLFSCQNSLSAQITLFLSTAFPLPLWSRHCEMLLCVPSSALPRHIFSHLSCTALPTALDL